jgi:hypothetical protein
MDWIQHFVSLRNNYIYTIFSIIHLGWGGGVDIKHTFTTFGTCITYTFKKNKLAFKHVVDIVGHFLLIV